jgi:hypothetical protein
LAGKAGCYRTLSLYMPQPEVIAVRIYGAVTTSKGRIISLSS